MTGNPSTLVGVLEPSIRGESLPCPLPPSLWTPSLVFQPNPVHPRGWTCFGPLGAKTSYLDTGSPQGLPWGAFCICGPSSMMNMIFSKRKFITIKMNHPRGWACPQNHPAGWSQALAARSAAHRRRRWGPLGPLGPLAPGDPSQHLTAGTWMV